MSIRKLGTASSEVNVLAHEIPQKPIEEKQEVIPVAEQGQQITTVENVIVPPKAGIVQKETRDAVIQKDIDDRNSDHYTLISARTAGKYNYIVNCKCNWQGKAITMGEANSLAREHKAKHLKD